MLRISLQESPQAGILKLEGKLSGPWVRELEECWLGATSEHPHQQLIVDLTQVSFIDSEGKALLARMYARGARFLACTPLNKTMVQQIIEAGAACLLAGALLGLVAPVASA
jgi:anti-anti-sigma factor